MEFRVLPVMAEGSTTPMPETVSVHSEQTGMDSHVQPPAHPHSSGTPPYNNVNANSTSSGTEPPALHALVEDNITQ